MAPHFDLEICAANIAVFGPGMCRIKPFERSGRLLYDTSKKLFLATKQYCKGYEKQLVEFSRNDLCKLRTTECPKGANYTIRFLKEPEYGRDRTKELKELNLRGLSNSDKMKLHALLLKLVGVEQSLSVNGESEATLKAAKIDPLAENQSRSVDGENEVTLLKTTAKIDPFAQMVHDTGEKIQAISNKSYMDFGRAILAVVDDFEMRMRSDEIEEEHS